MTVRLCGFVERWQKTKFFSWSIDANMVLMRNLFVKRVIAFCPLPIVMRYLQSMFLRMALLVLLMSICLIVLGWPRLSTRRVLWASGGYWRWRSSQGNCSIEIWLSSLRYTNDHALRQPYLAVPQKRGHILYVNFWFPNLCLFVHQGSCVRHTRHEIT